MNNREPVWISWFFNSAGSVLVITATAKLVSSFGKARILENPDVILHISHQKVFWLAAIVELIVAGICWQAKSSGLRSGAVAWLATVFLVYRVNLASYGHLQYCGCMGTLTDAIHIPEATADTIIRYLLAYLLVGSYAIFVRFWYATLFVQQRQPETSYV